ncbi:hypothetical protein J6590_006135 [Homalodisca vitripennis]|nr:hypothetical protein J6590_006135 [Homalodisca vitripennis]
MFKCSRIFETKAFLQKTALWIFDATINRGSSLDQNEVTSYFQEAIRYQTAETQGPGGSGLLKSESSRSQAAHRNRKLTEPSHSIFLSCFTRCNTIFPLRLILDTKRDVARLNWNAVL